MWKVMLAGLAYLVVIMVLLNMATGCGTFEVSGDIEVHGRTEHVVIICPPESGATLEEIEFCEELFEQELLEGAEQ